MPRTTPPSRYGLQILHRGAGSLVAVGFILTSPRIRHRRHALIKTLVLLLLLGTTALGQTVQPTCETTSATFGVLEKIAEPRVARVSSAERRSQQIAILGTALGVSPRDVVLHSRYQDLKLLLPKGRAEIVAEYETLLQNHPDNPLFLYLAARVLVGRDTRRSLAYLKRAVTLSPDYVWPHLLLADVALSKSFADPQLARTELATVKRLCPFLATSTPRLRWSDDKELIADEAQRLRKALAERHDIEAIAAYRTLWSVEAGMDVKASEQEAFKARISGDVKLLASGAFERNVEWYRTMSAAAQWLEDDALSRSASAEFAKKYPNTSVAIESEYMEWLARNPRPGPQAPDAERRAHFAARLAFCEDLAHRWPGTYSAETDRWYAVTWYEDATPSQVEAALDGLEVALQKDPEPFTAYATPFELDVADYLVRKGVRLKAVSRLVGSAFKSINDAFSDELASDLYPETPESRAETAQMKAYGYLTGYCALASAAIQQKDWPSARDAIRKAEDWLQPLTPGDASASSDRFRYGELASRFWSLKAELAAAEGRKIDALVLYRNAIVSYGPRRPRGDDRDVVMAAAKQIWKDLGGTDVAWNDWASTSSLASFYSGSGDKAVWAKLAAAQPDLELTDVRGTRWKPSDLANKTAFVNLWATWCAPCRAELPYLQKLADRLVERKDVVILSLNVDVDAPAVKLFLERQGLWLRAVPARDFAYRAFPEMALPSNWVVGPKGCDLFWADGSGDVWVDRAVAAIEAASVASAK